MKTLVSCVNAHQKVTAEDEFSNQIEKVTYFVNNQPLPSAISVIVQPLGVMRKVTMVTEMEVMHGLNKMSCDHQG